MAKGCWTGIILTSIRPLSQDWGRNIATHLWGVPPPVPSDPTLAGLLPVERQAPGGPPPPVGAVSSGLNSVWPPSLKWPKHSAS